MSSTTPTLSREIAVATAIRILDAEGAGALTMRRVTREMGVPLMSLYRHVPSKTALEDAVVEALMESLPAIPRSRAWETRIVNWARAYRNMVRAHPNAAPLLASHPAAGYGARADEVDTMLECLEGAGLTPRDARVHLRTAIITITGFCNTQAQAGQVGEIAPEPADRPADEPPRVAAFIEDVRNRRHQDEIFAAMLASVIAGITAALARRPSPGRESTSPA